MARLLARRLIVTAIVVLLHVGVFVVLMRAMYAPSDLVPTRLVETLSRTPKSQKQPRENLRALSGPPSHIPVPVIPVPHVDIESEQPSASALIGIGTMLFGCDLDRLARLTPDERARCPVFSYWHPTKPSEHLGPPDEHSPFAKVLEKRTAPAVPIEHVCTPGESPNANIGIPCYTFPSGTITGLLKGQN